MNVAEKKERDFLDRACVTMRVDSSAHLRHFTYRSVSTPSESL
jgi:hypothetical protein